VALVGLVWFIEESAGRVCFCAAAAVRLFLPGQGGPPALRRPAGGLPAALSRPAMVQKKADESRARQRRVFEVDGIMTKLPVIACR